jgi:hypothetical protein
MINQLTRGMKMSMKHGATVACLALVVVACADPATGPSRTLISDVASPAVVLTPIDFRNGGTYPTGLADGVVLLCKTGDAAGTFQFSVSVNGGTPTTVTRTLSGPGATDCGNNVPVFRSPPMTGNAVPALVVITEAAQANWVVQNIDINQVVAKFIYDNGGYTAPRLDDSFNTTTGTANVYINGDMARVVTFTNDFTQPPPPPPPPAICDFITFGRLVTEVGNKKVVISGNAGGFNADGSIKGEFHIEADGVDNHVHDIDSYGPITSGPLSGLTNSRIVTGIAKNGVAVELRLWDGGEPGKNTDIVYVKLNGVVLLNAAGQFINQGNMQYHANCRGPQG